MLHQKIINQRQSCFKIHYKCKSFIKNVYTTGVHKQLVPYRANLDVMVLQCLFSCDSISKFKPTKLNVLEIIRSDELCNLIYLNTLFTYVYGILKNVLTLTISNPGTLPRTF